MKTINILRTPIFLVFLVTLTTTKSSFADCNSDHTNCYNLYIQCAGGQNTCGACVKACSTCEKSCASDAGNYTGCFWLGIKCS
ncbi:MAG TPA: hypothetical protein VMW10_11545 [Alphaproteobacteria bacterium]|nr:hypothetical protein [Alphaproteobacteria bacterium]